MGFLMAGVQHIHNNLLTSGKAVDAFNKALGLLELMTEDVDVEPSPKTAVLSQFSSQTVSYSMVPLSLELTARITALVFGQASSPPPTTRKSASVLDLKMSHYGPDYELTVQQEREAGCAMRTGQSASLKSHGDMSAGGLAQRCVDVLLDAAPTFSRTFGQHGIFQQRALSRHPWVKVPPSAMRSCRSDRRPRFRAQCSEV